MDITEIMNKVTNCMIDTNEAFNEHLNDAINMHNGSVASFVQSLTTNSILSLLIKKGLISESEFAEELESQFNNSKQKEVVEYNRDILLQLVEEEFSYMNDLKEMHESMNNDTSYQDTPGYILMPDVHSFEEV